MCFKESASASVRTISHTVSGTTYVFSGYTTGENVIPYALSDTDMFKYYGVFRVNKVSDSAYNIKINNTNSGTTSNNSKYSLSLGNIYNLTFTPKDDTVFRPIWLQYGYTVKYQFNGTVATSSGSTYGADLTKDYKADSGLYVEINYAQHVQGMPFIAGEGLTIKAVSDVDQANRGQFTSEEKNINTSSVNNTRCIVLSNGMNIRHFFKPSSTSAHCTGTNYDSSNDYKIILQEDTYNAKSNTYTIDFSLVHNTGHNEKGNDSSVNAATGSLYQDQEIQDTWS